MTVPKTLTSLIQELFDITDGTTPEAADSEGVCFAVVSYPLPKDHWLTAPGDNVPPMGLRMGTDHPQHAAMVEKIRAAGRYAIRSATMNGREEDFDPDALIQNLVVGLLGYHTKDGLSGDSWANPDPIPPIWEG